MNGSMIKALGLDAIFQVLDNWVFRILAVLILLPVLATFVFGFREEHISFLFGLKEWEYGPLFEAFGAGNATEEAQTALIDTILVLTFDVLAGWFGVIFCIAATAFFVPRMIEKGAADILFHKPVSRLMFFLSRYAAGLLFVALLSVVLVTGMYLGLLLVSGYNDPGILWGAPALIYLFALIHGISMLVGVFTRSTVASILLTGLFFFGNGCIHNIWITVESATAVSLDEMHGTVEEEEMEEVDDGDDRSTFVRVLHGILNTLHYTLPKTTDTDYITRKLRRAVSAPDFEDTDTMFQIDDLPGGVDEVDLADVDRSSRPELYGEPLFAARGEDGSTYELWRRERREIKSERSGRVRTEFMRHYSDDLAEALSTQPGVADVREAELEEESTTDENGVVIPGDPLASFENKYVRWTEGEGGNARSVHAVLFSRGDWMYTIDHRGPPDASLEDFHEVLDESSFNPQLDDWYGKQIGFDAPLKYNIFFSIGSSLLFTLVMLALGWWRLSRIDF